MQEVVVDYCYYVGKLFVDGVVCCGGLEQWICYYVECVYFGVVGEEYCLWQVEVLGVDDCVCDLEDFCCLFYGVEGLKFGVVFEYGWVGGVVLDQLVLYWVGFVVGVVVGV